MFSVSLISVGNQNNQLETGTVLDKLECLVAIFHPAAAQIVTKFSENLRKENTFSSTIMWIFAVGRIVGSSFTLQSQPSAASCVEPYRNRWGWQGLVRHLDSCFQMNQLSLSLARFSVILGFKLSTSNHRPVCPDPELLLPSSVLVERELKRRLTGRDRWGRVTMLLGFDSVNHDSPNNHNKALQNLNLFNAILATCISHNLLEQTEHCILKYSRLFICWSQTISPWQIAYPGTIAPLNHHFIK